MFGGNRPGFGLNTPQTGFGGTPSFGATPGIGGQTTGMPGFGQQQGATAFGQAGMGASPGFGSTPQAGSVFGGATSTPFGQTGGFGQQAGGGLGAARPGGFGMGGATTGTGLGVSTGSAFGATPGTTFGATSTTGGFGQQTPGLGGATPGAGGAGLFGAPATGSAFGAGAQRPATGFGGFGAAGTGTTGFGATPSTGFGQQQGTAFGQAAPATGFGTPTPFGSTPNQASGFGGGASAWNQGGLGTRAAQPGSGNPPFKATQQSDSNGTGGGLIEAITAMDAYNEKSFEELRWEDYQRGNNKGGPSTAMGGGIGLTGGFGGLGTPQQTPGLGGFGGTATAGGSAWGQPAKFGLSTPATTGFGATGFGATAAKPGGFGATPTTGFGQTPGGTSLFGSTPAQTTTTGFGGLGQQPATGLGGGLGGFGTPQAGGLGTPGQTPSLFGTSTTPATGGFGLSGGTTGFGSTTSTLGTPQTGFGGFGSTANQMKPPATGGFGGFGTSTATTGFGTPSTGLGAAKPGGFGATTGFGTTPGTTSAWGTSTPQLGGGFGTPQAGSTGFSSTFKPSTPGTGLGGTTGFGGFGTPGGGLSGLGSTSTGFGGGLQTPGGFGATTGFGTPASTTTFPGMPTTSMQNTLLSQQQQMTPPSTSFLGGGGTPGLQGFGMSAPVPTPDQTNVLRLSSSGGKKDLGRSRSDSTEATPPALQSYRHTPRSAAKLYPRGMQRALEASGGSMVSEPGIVSPVNDSFTSRSIKTLHLDDGTDFYAPSNAETKLEPLDSDMTVRRRNSSISSLPTPSPRDSSQGGGGPQPPPFRLPSSNSIDGDGGGEEFKGMPSPPKRQASSSQRDLRPRLTKPGYSTVPSLEELGGMSEHQLRRVQGFRVCNEYGQVEWEGATDVAGLDLDKLVDIGKKEVVVYPEDADDPGLKPPVGRGLNKPAKITLFNVFSTKKKPEQYRKDLRTLVESWDGARFDDYDVQTGTWSFHVQHFSRYGVDDDDDDGAAPQQPPATGAAANKGPRATPISRGASSGGGGGGSRRGGYGLRDSDDEGEPMDQDGGGGGQAGALVTAQAAGGGRAGSAVRQASLDAEFDALARSDDNQEAEEEEDLMPLAPVDDGPSSADQALRLALDTIPSDIKSLTGVWGDEDAEPRPEQEPQLPWASRPASRAPAASMRRRMRLRSESQLVVQSSSRFDRQQQQQDMDHTALAESAPVGPPVSQPATPPPAPRSAYSFVQPAMLERELQASAKKAARGVVPQHRPSALVSSVLPVPRSLPPYLEAAYHEERRQLTAVLPGGSGRRAPHKPLDYAVFMGRSFRAGWGAAGLLVLPKGKQFVVKKLATAITTTPARQQQDGAVSAREYLEAPLRVHRGASSPLPPPPQPDADEAPLPAWSLPSALAPHTSSPSPAGYQALVDCIWKLADVAKSQAVSSEGRMTRAQVLAQTWGLVNALWGQEGDVDHRRPLPLHGSLSSLSDRLNEMWRQSQGDGEPPNWTDMERRKEAVSRWLQAAIADTPFVPGSVWDQEVLVLELLVRHRVEEAAAAALRLGLLRLATLIPMAGQDPARELLAEQVEAWENDGSVQHMSEEVLLVYRLLSGKDSDMLHEMGPIFTWYQSLGLYLWYLRCEGRGSSEAAGGKNDSLHQAIAEFAAHKPSRPVPWYVERRLYGDQLPAGLVQDVSSTLFSLLALYTDDKLPPHQVLEPLGLVPDQLDYLTPWLLMTTLHGLGLGEAWNPESRSKPLRIWPMVTSSLVFQLTSHEGLWPWAVYVAMHSHPSSLQHRHLIVRDIIDRFAYDASQEEVSFLVDLGVPMEWIHQARAQRLRCVGRFYQGPQAGDVPLGLEDAMTYYYRAKDWCSLHDLVMNVAAPRLILEDKEPLLLTLLQELEQHKESVAEWSRQGSLCLDYLKTVWQWLIPLIDRLQQGMGGDDVDANLRACLKALTAVYERLKGEPWCLAWHSHLLHTAEAGAPLRASRSHDKQQQQQQEAKKADGTDGMDVAGSSPAEAEDQQPAIMHAVRSNVMSNLVHRLHFFYRTDQDGSEPFPDELEHISHQVFHDYRLQQLDYAVDAHIRMLDN